MASARYRHYDDVGVCPAKVARVSEVVLSCTGVSVRRGEAMLLSNIKWTVRSNERWVVLGPNGAGKTTLLRIAAALMFPTSGSVQVLDEHLGATDLAELRQRIGWASGSLADDFPPNESVTDVVMTGAQAVTGRWRDTYDDVDRIRAEALIRAWGLDGLQSRTIGTLSEGERKRTLIARSLMADPELLLLDEPGAGLDLAGREDLVHRLSLLAHDQSSPAQVLITHHVEEIPSGFTHALLLRGGQAVAQGAIHEALTSQTLSEAFGLPLDLRREHGRLAATRAR
jgi:iron complex transport system ATP-binding protein